jgi:hypothetical protein
MRTVPVETRTRADIHDGQEHQRLQSKARVGILWRGDEAARRSATPETSRFKAVFSTLVDVGVDAEPVVYEDDVLEAGGATAAISTRYCAKSRRAASG